MSATTPKSLIIITGASRGIGQAIALSIASACHRGSNASLALPIHMVLIARSTSKLEETARIINEEFSDDSDGAGNLKIITSCHEMDLSDLETFPRKIRNLFNTLTESQFEHCWLFNNAGSVDPLGPTSSLANGDDSSISIDQFRTAVDLNITSVMWLSSMFTSTFASPSEASPSIRIINISSLCAIQPFPTMAVYCAGKAARDMYHAVLAKEMSSRSNEPRMGSESGDNIETATNNKVPSFKVLNYAPGACDTAMTDVLADCSSLDTELHDYFTNSKKDKKLIDPADSAKKLIEILMKDDYISGSHIDYWDV